MPKWKHQKVRNSPTIPKVLFLQSMLLFLVYFLDFFVLIIKYKTLVKCLGNCGSCDVYAFFIAEFFDIYIYLYIDFFLKFEQVMIACSFTWSGGRSANVKPAYQSLCAGSVDWGEGDFRHAQGAEAPVPSHWEDTQGTCKWGCTCYLHLYLDPAPTSVYTHTHGPKFASFIWTFTLYLALFKYSLQVTPCVHCQPVEGVWASHRPPSSQLYSLPSHTTSR